MALAIRQKTSVKGRLLSTLTLVFALVAQPLVPLNIPAAFAAPITNHVVINEIMAYSADGPANLNREWVELYNPTSTAVDMSGWRIKNGSEHFTNVFPAGTVIGAQSFLVREATSANNLNNTTAQLILASDVAGTVVDDVTYAGIAKGKSYARSYDASSDFVAQATPTKGTSNGSVTAPVVQPAISKIDPYYVVDKYQGIAVDISVDRLTDANGVEVRVDRSNGGPVIKTAKASVIAALNTGNPARVTAPIVIQQGTYDEEKSSSWNQPAQTWGHDTVPTQVTVTITRKSGGSIKSEPIILTETMGPFATLSQIMPAAPVPADTTPPTFEVTNLTEGQLVGVANTNKLVIKGSLSDPSGARALLQLVKPGVGVVADNVTVHAPVENGVLAEFNTAGIASGAYELHIRPTDYKGNAIPFYVIKFNMDAEAPAAPTNLTWKTSRNANIPNNGYTNILDGVASWQDNSGDDVQYLYTYWNNIEGNQWKEDSRYRPNPTSNLTQPGSFNQGEGIHSIQVFAIDKAGNVSEGSIVLNITYDKTPPSLLTFDGPYNVDVTKPFTISGTYTDELSGLGRLHLYILANGQELSSPLIVPASQLNKTSGAFAYTLSRDDIDRLVSSNLNLKNGGTFTVRAHAFDRANNWKRFTQEYTVAVPQPVVNGENFNINNDANYKGISVGFNIANFSTVTDVKVELFNGATPMVANTHNSALLALINGGEKQLSTPFVTVPGTYTEEFWTPGSYSWSSTSPKPTRAVVTVTGANVLGDAVTETATLNNLVEPNGWTFASILPRALVRVPVTPVVPVTDQNPSRNQGDGGIPAPTPIVGNAATTPIAPIISGVDTPAENTPESNDENDGSEILGEQENDTETPLEDTGEVLGFMDSKLFGLAWYLWLVIAAALVGGWLVLAAAIRRRREEQ